MPQLGFSTKAGTLATLVGRLKAAVILPLVRVPVTSWPQRRTLLSGEVQTLLGPGPYIVRSSAAAEDRHDGSLAGQFLSLRNVGSGAALSNAVDQVIASYGERRGNDDEVLVQPMLCGVQRAGVAFSRDPNTGAHYRVINYTQGEDTTAVTGGHSALTLVHATHSEVPPPADIVAVLALIDELETLFADDALDIEFAVVHAAGTEQVVLLQVRPLTMRMPSAAAESHRHNLRLIAEKTAQGFRPHPFLHGRATVYGVMPDWNPAEIIGVRPRPLALSLYRELITDATWAYQRHNYGYKNLRSFPLLVHFHGLPYIDVRVSFNSFLPRDIEGSLADRLVDHYINRLLAAPNLHDKVEFEIVHSCYTLDLPQRIGALGDFGFSVAERERLAQSLRHLTNRIIHQQSGLWRGDRDKLSVLTHRRDQVMASSLDPVGRIYWLLEDCKRYGTLPFAGLARAGFIAVQILKSLVAVEVFSPRDYDNFLASLNTVSGQLARDIGQLERTTFLARYGHLRPGTYDILSPRYDEAPDIYFNWKHAPATEAATEAATPFSLRLDQMRGIAGLLAEHGLDADVVGLFDFLQAGIELREYSKFLFTRNLSDALSLMRGVGENLGFSVDDLSYADVRVFYELHGASADARSLIERSIEDGRRRHGDTCRIWLPPLITRTEDVWSFHLPSTEPNFITQGRVTAPVVMHTDRERLSGAIVAIPSADPGFDWLFSHPIAGLITAYGGVNSHMAIRAGEMGLPAVIGAGEALFSRWSQAKRLTLDCASRRVEVLA